MSEYQEDRSVLTRPATGPDMEVSYGDVPEHIADVRYGSDAAASRPFIVVIHGGFWRPAFDRTHTGPMCEALAAAGWTNASIEYRRVPGQPQLTTDDVRTATSALPTLIKTHNGKVLVIGHSAGGQLALYVAHVLAKSLAGAVALAPAADLQMAERLGLGSGAAQAFLGSPAREHANIDPVRMPSAACPVAIVHGLQDVTVPISLAESYVAKHPKTRLIKVDQCGHFAVIDPLSAAWSSVLEELRRLS